MLCIIIAASCSTHPTNQQTNYIAPMREDREHMTMEQLVDILAQKTEKFTQLMVYKNFGDEYKECKDDIQQILAEIELRKISTAGQNQETAI